MQLQEYLKSAEPQTATEYFFLQWKQKFYDDLKWIFAICTNAISPTGY